MAASGLSCEKLIIRTKNSDGGGINFKRRLYMGSVIKKHLLNRSRFFVKLLNGHLCQHLMTAYFIKNRNKGE